MILRIPYFPYFDWLSFNFEVNFIKKPSIWAPKGSQCSLIGVLKTFLGASCGHVFPLWGPWGALGTALGAVQEPLGNIFLDLGAPRGPPVVIFTVFTSKIDENVDIFVVKLIRLYISLPPFNHSSLPVLQASMHPDRGRRNARSVWIIIKKGILKI